MIKLIFLLWGYSIKSESVGWPCSC